MRFLEYLFFKYYYFQVRVGNEDIAPYSAVLFIVFILQFVFVDILSFYFFFVPSGKKHSLSGPYSIVAFFVVTCVILYFLLIHKYKYKSIIEENELRWRGKKNIGAVLFAVIPFVLFFVELFIPLKM